MAAIEPTIIVIIVWYAILVGGGILLVLYRTNRRIQLRQYPSPHTPIGEDSHVAMKNQIWNNLERVAQVKIQPRFLTVEGSKEEEAASEDLIHRMQAVDSMRSLDRMVKEILPSWQKGKSQSEREFLYILSRNNAPLAQCPDICAVILDSYERARYGEQPYGENDKKVFLDMLMDVINRLSILNPEDFTNGPSETEIDANDVIVWLQAPYFNTPEFTRHSVIINNSSSNINRRSDAESRDLIDLSLSESDMRVSGDIQRPTSLEIHDESHAH